MTYYRCQSGPLAGTLRVPGDKSIGHRALMFGALAEGVTQIRGLSPGQDNSATANVLAALGVTITSDADEVQVHGVGLHGFRAPTEPLNCGNSGTTMRLMLGILAGQPFESTLIGDRSLSRRPMRRVLDPLQAMGLEVLEAREGTFPPLKIRGRRSLQGLSYDSPVASAQVKSAILLAGLYAEGEVSVRESTTSRDHTERLLAFMGSPMEARKLRIPGDLSSAAFLLAAALMVPGSDVTIEEVGVNPTRRGVLELLETMGARVEVTEPVVQNGEPSATLRAMWGPLRAFELTPALAVRAIDELPLLAVLASQATGISHLRHAAELRVKESDRISKTVELLSSFGIPVQEHPDGLSVHGSPDRPLKRGRIDARGDHRIAMCAALLGLIAPEGVDIEGIDAIKSSFPTFFQSLEALGALQSFDGSDLQSRK